MTIPEAINKENEVYFRSCNIDDLEKSEKRLAAVIKDGSINENNYANGEALLHRLKAKIFALKFFSCGYNSDDFVQLEKYLQEALPVAEKKAYKKTGLLLNKLLVICRKVNAITCDAESYMLKVRSYDGQMVAVSASECEKVADIFDGKIALANGLTDCENIFGNGVKFPDVKQELLDELVKISNFARDAAKKLAMADVEKFVNANVKDIAEFGEWRNFEYFSLVGHDLNNCSGANIVYTPFVDEATFTALKSFPSEPKLIRAEAFCVETAERIEKIFNYLSECNINVIILGMDKYNASNKNALLRQLILFGKNGGKIHIVDQTGTRKLYEDALGVAQGNITEADINFRYLSMPAYVDVIELFKNNGMISDSKEDYGFVKEKLPFIGFVGLNRAIVRFLGNKKWREYAADYSEDRRRSAYAFLANLPSQGQFIDSAWGDFSLIAVNKSRGKREFDYDDITEVNLNNIKMIMDGNYTLFEKCGLLSMYCTLHGDDKSTWKNCDNEEQSARATLATRMVMRALGCRISPTVGIQDKLSNALAGGLCCNGGKSILYRRDSVQNIDWFIDAICHECFHAFQNMAENEAWEDWYWTELGVTKGRIEVWRYNSRCYVDVNDKNHDCYMIQIIESDARAFASDCINAASLVWNTLRFE